GIDYDGAPAGVATVEPGDVRHASVRSTYMRSGSPGLVLLPRTTEQVARAVRWARTQPVPLAVRSGGHGISGRSTNDGGLVLDLRHLAGVEVVDPATRLVRVGPGARWGEVAQVLAPHGWAITSGDYGGVGVGGLATAGGVGYLGRAHGLTIDHVRAVEVVLADGSVVRADAGHEPELFWGVRGAGGNLGVVTSFDLQARELGDVGFAQLAFAVTDLARFLVGFGALVEGSPRDVTPFLLMGPPRGGQVVVQLSAMVAADDPDVVIDRLQPFAHLAPLVQQAVHLVPYAAVVAHGGGQHDGQGEPVTRSGLVEHLTEGFAADAEALVLSGRVPFFQVRSVGGAIADVPPDATAYAHRSAGFSVLAMGSDRAWLDERWDAMTHHCAGIYSSFETDPRPERIPEVYPEPTLTRLRALKARVDPEDLFGHNLSVAPR
ncbi:FAD-linked oxidase, partial [Cellulomonas bogoriensis 69B4 = DSM 16987]